MEDKIKIKVAIANRIYPLIIDSEQEEGVRKAAKSVNALIEIFERDYAVRDKQDATAMVAFQLASERELSQRQYQSEDRALLEKLEALCRSLAEENHT